VFLLNLAQFAGSALQRIIPSRLLETLAGTEQRIQQPVRMVSLEIPPYALGAQHAAVKWKLFPGLKADNLIAANLQLDAALLPTETAMSLYHAVNRLTGHITPAARRSVVEVRPELILKLLRRLR
jgi:hypothetical protein